MSRGYSATPLWGLRIVHISALRWPEFHQNRKDPMREIQRFPNLGHNLCKNDKQTLHDYIW